MSNHGIGTSSGLRLFTGAGPRLAHWSCEPGRDLQELGSLMLPANVQYAWPHPSRDLLYVVSSNGGQRHGPDGDTHHLTACTVDSRSGAIASLGRPLPLPTRPIHVTVDPGGHYVVVTFNRPAAIRVYAIRDDGGPGPELPQREPPRPGNYAHQARFTPDGAQVLSTALGGNASASQPEDPGAVNLFEFSRGQLGAQQVVAPNGGYGFGPRHLDIHPNGRWVYVSLERQNRLELFELAGGRLASSASASLPLLSRPQPAEVDQHGGAIHVHPNGRFVYGVNRAWQTMDHAGTPVFAGGENTLAAYEIDPVTGTPRLLQHVATRGIHCRTFAIDPSGTTLVAAHIMGLNVREGPELRWVPPGLSFFRIAGDGRLWFERFQPVETGGGWLFWMGIQRPRS